MGESRKHFAERLEAGRMSMYVVTIIENVDTREQVHHFYDTTNKRDAIRFIAKVINVPQSGITLNTRDRTEIVDDKHNLWNNDYRIYVNYE